MYSNRYGSLRPIAHLTDCRCHLCHEKVDLSTYGQIGLYGRETASIDHLVPQSWGGTDEHENLRLAHQGCNSHRGVEDFEETRLRLAGTTDAPQSATAWNVATLAGGAGAGLLAGHAFAHVDEDGVRHFNWNAAAVGSGVTALFITLLRAA